jgi:hypothetical protein
MQSTLALEVPAETAAELKGSAHDRETGRRALDDLISRALAYRTGPELKALFDFLKRVPHLAPYNAMLLSAYCAAEPFRLKNGILSIESIRSAAARAAFSKPLFVS